MRQRVMIAMALACEPKLLIADEPTTALDVTIQAQILDLLRSLQDRLRTAIILITHDLGVVAETAHRVVVMYAGRVVETAPVDAIFGDAQHPYTLGLLASVPRFDDDIERLQTIPGSVPHPAHMPAGCRFSPRCALATAKCKADEPPLRSLAPGHEVACWLAPIERSPPR
jgi:oligopeptide/dipeptide ABC transporter ATP-binding protein